MTEVRTIRPKAPTPYVLLRRETGRVQINATGPRRVDLMVHDGHYASMMNVSVDELYDLAHCADDLCHELGKADA